MEWGQKILWRLLLDIACPIFCQMCPWLTPIKNGLVKKRTRQITLTRNDLASPNSIRQIHWLWIYIQYITAIAGCQVLFSWGRYVAYMIWVFGRGVYESRSPIYICVGGVVRHRGASKFFFPRVMSCNPYLLLRRFCSFFTKYFVMWSAHVKLNYAMLEAVTGNSPSDTAHTRCVCIAVLR